MMEFVCCVVIQKPWRFEHKLALTPVRVPSAGQAQGSVVWWFKALVLRGPAGGPKPEGSQARGVSNPGGSKTSDPKHGGPKTRVPSLGVSRPGVPSPGAQAQEGPKPGGVPSLGGPNPRGKGGVPSLGIPRPGVTSLKSNIRLPTSWAAFWDKSLPFALLIHVKMSKANFWLKGAKSFVPWPRYDLSLWVKLMVFKN